MRLSIYEPQNEKNRSSGVLTQCDTNWPVQSLKKARSLKFGNKYRRNSTIHVVKTTALLSCAVTALCFSIGKNQGGFT